MIVSPEHVIEFIKEARMNQAIGELECEIPSWHIELRDDYVTFDYLCCQLEDGDECANSYCEEYDYACIDDLAVSEELTMGDWIWTPCTEARAHYTTPV